MAPPRCCAQPAPALRLQPCSNCSVQRVGAIGRRRPEPNEYLIQYHIVQYLRAGDLGDSTSETPSQHATPLDDVLDSGSS